MRRILIVSIVALALAGCTAAPPPQPSPSVTVAPTPTRSAATKPALGDLVIGTDGLGPVRLGRPVPVQSPDVAVATFDPQYCKSTIEEMGGTFTEGAPFSGAWVTTYADPLAFTIVTEKGTQDSPVAVVEANAWQPATRSPIGTAAGVHAGDSRATLESAYSTFTSVTHFDLSDIYTIVGSGGQLVFEVSNASVTDQPDRVLSIRAVRSAPVSPGEVGQMYATDGGGPCPF